MELEHRRVTRAFATPQETAHGLLRTRELIEVTLTDADGVSGRGEAAPLPSYDGVTLERAERALHAYRDVLAARDGEGALDACRAADPLAQALAAIDIAEWDLAGRRARRPVCELLADAPAAAIEVNANIAVSDPREAARAAAAAVAAGYRCVKLKVGMRGDLERVARVREAIGQHVLLRLDANGALGVDEAAGLLGALAPFGLELVEEPVSGLAAVRALRARTDVAIAIDETAGEDGALASGAADAVCLKLSRCGGIAGLLAAAALVRASGAEVYLASTYDGPLGIAAALHAAAALAPLAPCGLATLELFAGAPSPLPVVDGRIAVPRGPGLGV